jgi:hypothetical protein
MNKEIKKDREEILRERKERNKDRKIGRIQ